MQSEDDQLDVELRRFDYTCPSCGSVLPGLVEQCPNCGHDLLDSFSGTFRHRRTLLAKVISVLLLLLIVATLAAVLVVVVG